MFTLADRTRVSSPGSIPKRQWPSLLRGQNPLAICESTSVHCGLVDWASQRGKTRINDQRNLAPHAGVVLDLMMGLVERAGEPRIVSTINAVTFVSHMKIADDL